MSAGVQNNVDTTFQWNAWAISKSNFLTWRAIMGKLPTKIELRKRGVVLPDVNGDRCGYGIEDANHAFVNCLLAKGIWWSIFVWVRVPLPSDVNSVASLVGSLDNAPGSKKWKKVVDTIFKATFWRIWYARNQQIFEGKFMRVQELVEQIKEDSYLWLKHRSKLPAVSWESWLDFDISGLL
ncbi:uncharacterized protein LOC110886382 [Helianthus annuus]|uniref:uncharacterized protein LOC110886382 n=1 Tax=Helianthus annuus TaxID=4232 RepID=UPI000B8F41CD|nr:uncharacterized protein LOC110886382 [Helianthus annuus]